MTAAPAPTASPTATAVSGSASSSSGSCAAPPSRRPPMFALPIELAVCLPLGIVANVVAPDATHKPDCITRGRYELRNAVVGAQQRIEQAKATGQVAIAFGVPILRRKLEAKLSEARRGSASPQPNAAGGASSLPATTASSSEDTAVAADPAADRESQSNVGDLAIPGYDSLSASQVVERLAGLSTADRDLVRAYEVCHRGRRTILGKLDQLQPTVP